VPRPREQLRPAPGRPRAERGRPAHGGHAWARIARIACIACIAIAAAACGGSAGIATGDVGTAQTIVEMGEAVNALQQETAAMQAQVDSLSAVVARQDTVLRRIAGMAGVPLPVQ
jgi:hypothetical protein